MADAMFAPVVTRLLTYDVKLDSDCAAYCTSIMEMPPMREWVARRESRDGGIGRGVLKLSHCGYLERRWWWLSTYRGS